MSASSIIDALRALTERAEELVSGGDLACEAVAGELADARAALAEADGEDEGLLVALGDRHPRIRLDGYPSEAEIVLGGVLAHDPGTATVTVYDLTGHVVVWAERCSRHTGGWRAWRESTGALVRTCETCAFEAGRRPAVHDHDAAAIEAALEARLERAFGEGL